MGDQESSVGAHRPADEGGIGFRPRQPRPKADSGTPVGVTVLVFTEAGPVPTELMEETVNEYVVPSTMPMLNVAVS